MRPMLVCFVMLSVLCSCGIALAAGNTADFQTLTTGPFTMNIAPKEESAWSITMYHEDTEILQAESYMLHPGAEASVRSNFPKKGCTSLLVPAYSGGAHCCMDLYVATHCGSEALLSAVGLGHSEKAKYLDVDEDGVTEILIQDWALAYYGPQGADFSLAFVESLPTPRVVAFGPKGWAMDTPGQFRVYYTMLRKSLEVEITDPYAAAAMAWMGMAIMEGLPKAEQAAGFNKRLPAEWKPYASAVMKDVREFTLDEGLVETLYPKR